MLKIFRKKEALSSLIAIGVIILILAGYWFWSSGGIKTGTRIIVAAPVSGAEVYVDSVSVGTSHFWDKTVTASVAPGPHNVVIGKTDYWPWTKDISVEQGEARTLHPFFVPKTIQKEPIASDDKEVVKLFETSTIRDASVPLLPKANIPGIRSADLYPGRDDVLIVAAQNLVFAIDVDGGTPVNYEPIYGGQNPYSVVTKNGTVYIKDGEQVYRLNIF